MADYLVDNRNPRTTATAPRRTPKGVVNAPPHAGDSDDGDSKPAPEVYKGPLKKVRRDDVIFFANQLAVMVDTGVPLSEALDSIQEQTTHNGMLAVVSDMNEQVKAGVEFSNALARHPKIFSRLFIALMRASEASGTMGQMLQRVSEYMRTDRDTRKQIKGAMVYPLCMLTFCVLVVTGILVFILPRFEKIYAGKGAALPVPTRILMMASNVLVNYWYAVLLIVGGGIFGILWYLKTPAGRKFKDRVLISLPIIGAMYRKSFLARSMRTMATMISSGVTILDGLAITSMVSGNHYYERIWDDLADHVQQGATLSERLRTQSLIPSTVAQMVYSGEKSGKLGLVMDRVADFCEDDLKSSVKAVTSMIEPLMIIVMGGVIGSIALALLLPVFNISKIMTK